MTRKPIVYQGLLDIRVSDLDLYGHVNSKHYIDFVSTVRLNFMENEMKTPLKTVAERGAGFFMSKSTVQYKRPISSLQKILVRSHIKEILNGSTAIIPFEICTAEGTKIYAEGVLEFAVIDLKTLRPMQTPDWMLNLFFEA